MDANREARCLATDFAEQLRLACNDLSQRLRAGTTCRAEDFLTDAGAWVDDRDCVLELLYTEFVVREQLGQQPEPQEWYGRFPRWQTDLEELFEVHCFVRQQEAEHQTTVAGPSHSTHDDTQSVVIPKRRVAGYELLEEIGRGGMGVVYKARQLSVNRIVALKMILAGEYAGPSELARFRTEAESAASLQHPHIAQIYEAGDHHGHAYLSMELVEGTSLESMLTPGPLPARSAAELTATLASAVHYAHERGIIHRDLKPSNVLLTDKREPKITDFGLAKRYLADEAQGVTRTGAVLGTPSYMAPEQAAGIAVARPAADVYALGAILYEMLTGRPPFVSDSALETLKQVQEREPVPPRQFDDRIPLDLETICLKCLEKEPARRYPSAADLADDVRHFLTDEPIVARPATTIYRLGKFARRNKRLVAGVATILAVLVAGIASTTVQAFRATRQKQIAEAETEFATEVKEFLSTVFTAVIPYKEGNTVTVREALDRAVTSLEEDPPGHARVEAEIRRTIGSAYQGLGLYNESEYHLTRALERSRLWYGEPHVRVASDLKNLGFLYIRTGEYEKSERYFRDAIAMYYRNHPVEEPSIASALVGLAHIYKYTARYEQAEAKAREALAIHHRLTGDEEGEVNAQALLAYVLNGQRRMIEAEEAIHLAIELSRRAFGDVSAYTATSLNTLAIIYTTSGRLAEAVALQRDVIGINEQLMGEDHPELAACRLNLAMMLRRLQKNEEAEPEIVLAGDIFQRHLGSEHPHTLAARAALGFLFLQTKRLEEAEPILREVLEKRLHVLGEEHHETTVSMSNLAGLWRRRGEYAEAGALYERAVDIRRRIHGPDDPRTISALNSVALNTYLSGDLAGAAAVYRDVFERRLATLGADHARTRTSLEKLINVLQEIGLQEAANALRAKYGAPKREEERITSQSGNAEQPQN